MNRNSGVSGRKNSMITFTPLKTQRAPFRAAAERLGAALFLHPAGLTDKRFAPYHLWNSLGQPLEEAMAMAATVAAMKPDLLKIRVDDNLKTALKMGEPAWRAAIAEAHARKLPIAVHVFYLADAKATLAAGADLIAHSVRDQAVDAAFITANRDHGCPRPDTIAKRRRHGADVGVAPPGHDTPDQLRPHGQHAVVLHEGDHAANGERAHGRHLSCEGVLPTYGARARRRRVRDARAAAGKRPADAGGV